LQQFTYLVTQLPRLLDGQITRYILSTRSHSNAPTISQDNYIVRIWCIYASILNSKIDYLSSWVFSHNDVFVFARVINIQV